MKNSLFIPVLLSILSLASCGQTITSPDGMHHDSLTATYDHFCNPERGFHSAKEFHCPNPTPMTVGTVKLAYDMGYSLIHIDYYMEDYRDCAISESYLDMVRQNMQALREGGCKCVLRFAYTYGENQQPREAPVDTVLLHISQIKPILQEYSDVIYTMEAGFVGVWGEWYYTTYFKQNPTVTADFADRRRVLDALLDALPEERQLCVRTPVIKMKCYGWTLSDTLTRAEAFTNTPKARLACHDDAFVADQTDMGTFGGNAYRDYWASESKYTIFGGETCQKGAYSSCDNSIEQMKKFHASYLNISYHPLVIADWKNNGCLEDIRRLLGYRLVCTDVATTPKPKIGEELKVVLTLENEGFAAPKNPRDVRVLLVNAADSTDVMSITPDCEPRLWGPEGEHKINAAFRPKNAGAYKIYLHMPDPKPILAKDSRFAIRLANKDCWDEVTGYNYLTTVTVE